LYKNSTEGLAGFTVCFFLGEKQNRCGDFQESKKTQQHMSFASGLFWNCRREKCYPTESETTTRNHHMDVSGIN